VHDGRIVNFYAGQGSVVHKGQKLADLESADIDEAEADYLKALNDLENANRTSAAEIKFNQQTYDRTKLLVEKEISPAKNLQQAEHDLDVAKANAANSISSAKVEVDNAKRHLMILGMSEGAVGPIPAQRTDLRHGRRARRLDRRDGRLGRECFQDNRSLKRVDRCECF
jgi:multidrug efflux pump subunit AcrA (membrane-fusion protein)